MTISPNTSVSDKNIKTKTNVSKKTNTTANRTHCTAVILHAMINTAANGV